MCRISTENSASIASYSRVDHRVRLARFRGRRGARSTPDSDSPVAALMESMLDGMADYYSK